MSRGRPTTIDHKNMTLSERRAYQRVVAKRHEDRKKAGQSVRRLRLGDMTTCKLCGVEKPFTAEFFAPRGDGSSRLHRRCNPCHAQRLAFRGVGEYKKYGLTKEGLATLRTRPCVLCGSTKLLRIDHCHATGKLRNTLCNACNSGLGFFRDRPDLLRLAAQYVEHYAARHAGAS